VTKFAFQFVLILALCVVGLQSQEITAARSIPEQLAGRWVVKRILPTNTISCWSQKEIDQFIGTELQYARDLFRWKSGFIN
jgi:hypothetical protein